MDEDVEVFAGEVVDFSDDVDFSDEEDDDDEAADVDEDLLSLRLSVR